MPDEQEESPNIGIITKVSSVEYIPKLRAYRLKVRTQNSEEELPTYIAESHFYNVTVNPKKEEPKVTEMSVMQMTKHKQKELGVYPRISAEPPMVKEEEEQQVEPKKPEECQQKEEPISSSSEEKNDESEDEEWKEEDWEEEEKSKKIRRNRGKKAKMNNSSILEDKDQKKCERNLSTRIQKLQEFHSFAPPLRKLLKRSEGNYKYIGGRFPDQPQDNDD